MNFKGIGIERKREMFFNIVFPFIIAFYEDKERKIIQFLNKIFELHPPLTENSIIKSFRKSLPESLDYSEINISAKTYFGIIFYMKYKKNLSAPSFNKG